MGLHGNVVSSELCDSDSPGDSPVATSTGDLYTPTLESGLDREVWRDGMACAVLVLACTLMQLVLVRDGADVWPGHELVTCCTQLTLVPLYTI